MTKTKFPSLMASLVLATTLTLSCEDKEKDKPATAAETASTATAATAETAMPNTPPAFTDSRDGKTYKKVAIGKQTWMAENLNFAPAKGSVCYDAKESYCNKFGRLYNWEAAKQACPAGWHLPTQDEWTALAEYAGGNSDLKSKTGWRDGENGNDTHGFTALPGGYIEDRPIPPGEEGGWWTATEVGADGYAYIKDMTNYRENLGWESEKKHLFSVRCVQN